MLSEKGGREGGNRYPRAGRAAQGVRRGDGVSSACGTVTGHSCSKPRLLIGSAADMTGVHRRDAVCSIVRGGERLPCH